MICAEKLLLQQKKEELNSLDFIYKRGQKNGIKGLKKLSPSELFEYEPYANGLSALYCPETGIINYNKVCEQLSKNIQKSGEIVTNGTVVDVESRIDGITVITENMDYKTNF